MHGDYMNTFLALRILKLRSTLLNLSMNWSQIQLNCTDDVLAQQIGRAAAGPHKISTNASVDPIDGKKVLSETPSNDYHKSLIPNDDRMLIR